MHSQSYTEAMIQSHPLVTDIKLHDTSNAQ
jgi:hypothetical protein